MASSCVPLQQSLLTCVRMLRMLMASPKVCGGRCLVDPSEGAQSPASRLWRFGPRPPQPKGAASVGSERLGQRTEAVVADLDQLAPRNAFRSMTPVAHWKVARIVLPARRWECRRQARRSGPVPGHDFGAHLRTQQIGLGLVGCVPGAPAIEYSRPTFGWSIAAISSAHLCHRLDEGGISSRTTMSSGRHIPARAGFHGP